jgi:hypothetical protein
MPGRSISHALNIICYSEISSCLPEVVKLRDLAGWQTCYCTNVLILSQTDQQSLFKPGSFLVSNVTGSCTNINSKPLLLVPVYFIMTMCQWRPTLGAIVTGSCTNINLKPLLLVRIYFIMTMWRWPEMKWPYIQTLIRLEWFEQWNWIKMVK